MAVILDGGHNTFTDACAQIRGLGGLDTQALSEAPACRRERLPGSFDKAPLCM